MIKHCFASLSLTSLLMMGACTASQTPEDTKAPKPPLPTFKITAPTHMPSTFERQLIDSPEHFKRRVTISFERLAKNDEVHAEQIEAMMIKQQTNIRGQLIGLILAEDKNNDGELGASEFLSLLEPETGSSPFGGSNPKPLSQGDRNGDGVFSAKEIRAFTDLFIDLEATHLVHPMIYLMTFDTNQDRVLTRDELNEELKALTEPPQKGAVAKRLKTRKISEKSQAQNVVRDEVCKSGLKLPTDAEIILLSGYEGTALSTVTVTDQTWGTEVTQVIIEDGKRPLHIIAGTFTDMIWSIEGNSDRVSGFITIKSRNKSGAGAGVVGLSSRKVDFIPNSCMKYFSKESSMEGNLAKTLFERINGRPADHVVASYKLDSVSLPSGAMKGRARRAARRAAEKANGAPRTNLTEGIALSALENYKPAHQTALYSFSEDGIAYVDASKVVSPSPLINYIIYPDHAGIAQLIETGHLEKVDQKTYYIHKTFAKFPAGLGGAHSVKFILGKGVQKPGGSPGHSVLIDEATGRCISAQCPRE